MKIAYFDCSSGIAGDMILSALIDTGVSVQVLNQTLKKCFKVELPGIKVVPVERNHLPAKLVKISSGKKHFRSPAKMKKVIKSSKLSKTVKKQSLEILNLLIKAESKAHGIKPGRVHLHELSSIDTLIDIVGTCVLLDLLKIDKIYSSYLNIGTSAPATVQILKENKIPVFSSNIKQELTTPTGAAIIAKIAASFTDMPLMNIDRCGFGAGLSEIPGQANILRVLIGSPLIEGETHQEQVLLLETNIDDMDPRIYPYVQEKILDSGALDVWLTNILMKKGRPGIILSVLAPISKETEIIKIIFNETTTLGIRKEILTRYKLPRINKGKYKVAVLPDGKKKSSIEYNSAVNQARKTNIPLRKLLK